MRLNQLSKVCEERKRVGRGLGSGLGRYCTRGRNGAKCRNNSRRSLSFRQTGGQNPFWRMHGKVGFVSRRQGVK